MIYPVILCGGSGTRLWPVSRQSYPKQFARLTGDESLFQGTVRRFAGAEFAPPVVVANNAFRFIVGEQMTEIEAEYSALLIEPSARDTAPAILAAALYLHRQDPDAMMLVAPSDHMIGDPEAFRRAVLSGVAAARKGMLVLFGVEPDRAETGYGYLELNAPRPAGAEGPVPLKAFVEKPTAEVAAAFNASGRHLWNAGIFLFTARDIIAAYEELAPDIVPGVRAATDGARADLDFVRLEAAAWRETRAISVDYAIMEPADNLVVVPYAGQWSDMGDWQAIWREAARDEGNVVTFGAASAVGCTDTILRSETPGQELIGLGLNNICAVAMPDAVLVSDLSRSQDVGEVVKLLRARGAPQATEFPRVHRPWGWFETLSLGERFQVKRIMVKQGAALSLQSHVHRSEHWVVVRGSARVTIGEKVSLVSENQSVYIPLGERHRLENPGKLDLHLIEVQTGAYLGEDDITRYEDVYARV